MAAIEIPADYFRVDEGRFAALVQPFSDQLAAVHGDAADASGALVVSDRTDASTALGEMDADAGNIANAIGSEHGDVTSTPTGDVLGNYANADGLTASADSARPVDLATDPPHSRIVVPPPPLPHGTPPPDTPPDGTGVPRNPGAPGGPVAVPRPTPAPSPAPSPSGGGGDGGNAPPQTEAAAAPAAEVPIEPAPVAPPPPADAGPDPGALPVTRAELLEVLNNLDLTINLQV